MIYKLPTTSNRKYRGLHPLSVHSISLSAMDIDGNKCAHIELNDGTRYTISHDVYDDCTNPIGVCWFNLLTDTGMEMPVNEMTQYVYDHWLAVIRAQRALKAAR